jgi:hypothetical protein
MFAISTIYIHVKVHTIPYDVEEILDFSSNILLLISLSQREVSWFAISFRKCCIFPFIKNKILVSDPIISIEAQWR